MLTMARQEKYTLQSQLRDSKTAVKRLEMKQKKMEVQHEIDMKRNAQLIKNKQKMKFMAKGAALEEAFKKELTQIKFQFQESRLLHHKKDKLITKFGGFLLRQESQNIQLRTELLMNDHPRWQLIPTFEFISIIDLSKLVRALQKREQPSLFKDRPLEDDEELERLLDQK